MMKRLNCTAMIATMITLMFGSVGCNKATDANKTKMNSSASDHSHDHGSHDHGADGHDHSVEGHSHGVGPHGGTVADWGGGKYHVEFTVDHDKQQATVYIFGTDEKTPSAIEAMSIELSIKEPEMLVTLQAAPQESDPQGKSSRFIGTHEKLGVVQEYAGTMTGVIDGTPYSGDFAEEAHGDHSH